MTISKHLPMPDTNEIARADAIGWVRIQMTQYGLTLSDLLAAGCFAPAAAPRYRNAEGQTWDGRGERPEWMQRAINAGQRPEFFRID